MDLSFSSYTGIASTSAEANGRRLLEAIRDGESYDMILLEHNLDFGFVDEHGRNSLHWAAICRIDDVPIVGCLMANGASVYVQDIYNSIPLHLAVYHNSIAVVQALLQGDEINFKGADGKSALHWAVSSIREDATAIVNFLLKNGANPDALDDNGCTPLYYAVQIGCYSTEMAKQLSEGGANPNLQDRGGFTPLHVIIPNSASEAVDEKVVKRLCQYGASGTIADNNGYTPLHQAAAYASLAVIKCLLNAIPPQEASCIDLPDKDGKTALHWAVENQTPDKLGIVKALVRYGAGVAIASNDGQTALHRAVSSNSRDTIGIVDLLLKNKADPNLQDKSGCTPLHRALPSPEHGGAVDEKIVKRLCQYGASGTIADNDGYTPLHQAASYASLAVVDCLLDAIPSEEALLVDLPDKYGQTVLHSAVGNEKPDKLQIVQALVRYGAFCGAKDENGFTPLDYAKQCTGDNKRIIRALREGGSGRNDEVTLGAQFNQMSLSRS